MCNKIRLPSTKSESSYPKFLKMKSILSILFIVIIFASSCQKELSATIPVIASIDSSNMLKTYTEDYSSSVSVKQSVSFNVFYDGNKQITSLISSTNAGDRILFNYPFATKYTQDLFISDTLIIHEDFYNNSKSFLDSTYQYSDSKDTSTEKYFYNSNNLITQMKEYQYNNGSSQLLNTINYTYNSDGDLLTATGTDSNIETYSYYTDSVYLKPLIFGILNANSTKKVHLPKTYSLTSNSIVVTNATYTYTFDVKRRISTETESFSDGSSLTKTYTYY